MNTTLNRPIAVYRANQRHELGFFRTWMVMAKNVIKCSFSVRQWG